MGRKPKLLTPTFIYEDALLRLEELRAAENRLLENQKLMPPGKIHVSVSNKKVWYYLRNTNSKGKEEESVETYLSKNEREKIRTYLQKAYDEKALKLITKERKNLELFVARCTEIPDKIQAIYDKYPEEVQEQVIPVDISPDIFAKKWEKIESQMSNTYEKKFDFITERGEQVRSKSEMNIANMLFRHDIPYRYEFPLKIRGDKYIYPDFTVLNKKLRKVLYWEHRGRMDDRNYANDSVQKIKDYEQNNIFLGDHLIITEETINSPLGTPEIKAIIKHYLL